MQLPVGFHRNVPAEDYHLDPAPSPSLSAHTAVTLLSRSPEHARLYHPRLGGFHERESNERMVLGEFIHGELLGGGRSLAVLDFDDYKKKAAQEARDAAIAEGKMPILKHKHEAALKVADRIRYTLPFEFSKADATEATCIWESMGIFCRARIDSIFGGTAIYDLKTCENAKVSASARNLVAHGYHVQAASNIDAIETLTPDLTGRVRFFDLFVETSAPHGVLTVAVDGALLELGQRQWKRAKLQWAAGLASGEKTWPIYPREPQRVEVPAWMLSDELDASIEAAGNEPF